MFHEQDQGEEVNQHPYPDIATLRGALTRDETTVEAVISAYMDRIDEREPEIRAFVWHDRERALAQARDLDRRRANGEHCGPLFGVPIALKDNIVSRDEPTTACSRILAGFLPPYDATVVQRLRHAGAVFVGKTNMDEFAMGSSTENSALGPTRNPHDLDCIPGGSSGGSAAAVAAGECLAALGSDTGGSIRQPASLCGVVGFKPTYGRISRYGLIAFASSLDQIGPLTTTVGDAATLYDVMAGPDARDSTTAPRPFEPLSHQIRGDLTGLRLGVPRAFLEQGIDAPVQARFDLALLRLQDRGATLVDIALPHARQGIAVYYLLATAEASSNLERYDGVKFGPRAAGTDASLIDMYEASRGEGFGPEVKRRIILGTYALSAGYYDAYYGRAQKVRRCIASDFDAAFETCDLVVTPTSPVASVRLGERIADPLQMYVLDALTVLVNLAGLPAISVPMGDDGAKHPVGLQFIGRAFDESGVFNAAAGFESAG